MTAHFEGACDSNSVFEGIALWTRSTFIGDEPASNLKVQVTFHGGKEISNSLVKGKE